MSRKLVYDRSAGVTQSQQFCDFIESLSGRVITSMADVLVRPVVVLSLCQIKMSVAAGDHQRKYRET
jgi:hypothetical protein